MKELEGYKGSVFAVDELEDYRDGKIVTIINPQDIKYLPVKDFTVDNTNEKIAEGNWDLCLTQFDDIVVYEAYEDVFLNHKDWRDTNLYSGEYQAGITRLRYFKTMGQDEIVVWKNLRCKYLSFIFKSMREFGYHQDPYSDYVSILIGRNGEIILNNGRHRLTAAKLLNIKEIPILIDIRHIKWVAFKNSILEYSKQHGNMIYAPLKHVDLKDIPSRQDDRTQDVLDNISSNSKTVVDLGANWGTMCRVLEDNGFECTAIEVDDIEFEFLRKFRNIGDYKYRIFQGNISDFKYADFDCILALSIFHHLAKTEEGHAKLIKLLNNLKCDEMIFQMPDNEEMKSFKCYKNYSAEEFTKLIIDNSCLSKCREIGDRKTRRMFYLC